MGGVDVLIRHSLVVLLADVVNFVNPQTVAEKYLCKNSDFIKPKAIFDKSFLKIEKV